METIRGVIYYYFQFGTDIIIVTSLRVHITAAFATRFLTTVALLEEVTKQTHFDFERNISMRMIYSHCFTKGNALVARVLQLRSTKKQKNFNYNARSSIDRRTYYIVIHTVLLSNVRVKIKTEVV